MSFWGVVVFFLTGVVFFATGLSNNVGRPCTALMLPACPPVPLVNVLNSYKDRSRGSLYSPAEKSRIELSEEKGELIVERLCERSRGSAKGVRPLGSF